MPRKKPDTEYTLSIALKRDEMSDELSTIMLLETTRLFRSFRYEIVVRESVEDRTITLHMSGLRSPLLAMPETGSARWKRDFGPLAGTYEIIVEKPDGERNQSTILISEGSIHILKKPIPVRSKRSKRKKAFLEILTFPPDSHKGGT